MKGGEILDESAGNLVREYAKEKEICLVIRTIDDSVRVIAPDTSREVMAKMLRIAASMLEEPKSKQLN